MRYLIAIDEAGRGPLAGPVAVGLVMVPEKFDVAAEFPGVRDSKKLSEKKREEIFEALKRRAKVGDIRFCVCFSSHARIDKIGITQAVNRALTTGVQHLTPRGPSSRRDIHIFLDGLLHAPSQYSQETIIRGDDLVPLISLASIAAKVTRDRLMRQMAKKFPVYGFELHKGYGTLAHRNAILKHGMCEIHRKSFCKNILRVQ